VLLLSSKPVRTVLRWQLIVTAVVALGAWQFAGFDGAISAVLGGLINVVAGFVYFAIASMGRLDTAGATVRRLLRAEASKIMVIVGALYFALTLYEGVAFVPLFIAFAITAFMPGVAFLVRDEEPRAPQAR
jgi:ATP synthase protein I